MKRRVLWPDRAEAVAAIASAALFALSFPPFPFVLPAFLCLVPAALAVARRADTGQGARSAIRIGFWFGFAGYAANLYWIAIALSIYTRLAILGYIASLLVLAPVTAAAFGALYAMRRRTRWPIVALLPIVWTASEVVLNYLHDLAFPWLPLGLATAPVPVLAQLADLTGVRGISFWMATVGGVATDAWLYRARTRGTSDRRTDIRWYAPRALVVLASFAFVAAYGAWRMRTTVLRRVAPIGIIQPNIPQTDKWQEENRERIVGLLVDITRAEFARSDPALMVWPEAALPGFMQQHPDWTDTITALARGAGVPVLFGVLDLDWRGAQEFDYYNAAMLADSMGRIGTQPAYHKERLVPIVERVPFLNPRLFSGLRYFGGFGEGTGPVVYRFPFGAAGVLICYESIFPQIAREYRKQGADVLLNITNDAWFGRSLAPYQHHAHLVLRAIETRAGVVRSANTGISGYIDPLGRVRAATPLFEARSDTYVAETTDVRTLYVRIGDWLGTLCLAATAIGVIAAARRRRSAPETVSPPADGGPPASA